MIENPPALIPFETLEAVAPSLRVMAHPVRLRLVQILLELDVSVGELAQVAGVSPRVASQHLASLRAYGVVTSSRRGKEVFYEVAAPEARLLIASLCAHSA